MSDERYLFVDGGYLRLCFDEVLYRNFGDYQGIVFPKCNMSGADRVFFYDCIDDIQRDGEPDDDFEKRVAEQEQEFARIAHLTNWHVRQGTLSGNARRSDKRGKRQQKEVDVLLAVDMMNHAFRENMTTAILLTGDLDFKPVVESLVQMGTRVVITGCPATCSRPLRESGDAFYPITAQMLFHCSRIHASRNWTDYFPDIAQGNVGPPTARMIAQSSINERKVTMHQDETGRFSAYLEEGINADFQPVNAVRCLHPNRQLIEKYLSVEYGISEWIEV